MFTLTFNMSVAGNKKKDLSLITNPLQIMPETRNFLSEKIINNYFENNNKLESVIHTSYITLPFSSSFEEKPLWKINIENYIKLSEKIGFKRVLIHSPKSILEWKNLGFGMSILNKLFKNTDIILVLEIPAFANDLMQKQKENNNFIFDYIDTLLKYENVLENKFELCFDTAHLFSNGCDVNKMIEIIEKYKMFTKIIHLNGNKKNMYTSDEHVPIGSEYDKIQHSDDLLKYLSTTDLIGICEITKQHATWDYWVNLSKKYNLNLVPFNENYSI